MHMHNGTLTFSKDNSGNDIVTAYSKWTGETVEFLTSSAATFWLWVIDEREGGKKQRMALKNN